MESSNYWSHFYATSRNLGPSAFAEWVDALGLSFGAVVDLGCGDGRDTIFWAAQERCSGRVLGIDQSATAIERGKARADASGTGEAQFLTLDIGEADWSSSAREMLWRSESTLFYMRFLLHAIPAWAQDTLLKGVRALCSEGDYVAMEFRTTNDSTLPKTFPEHFRRYQASSVVVEEMRELGFNLVKSVEGFGLSPFQGEDPHLCRLVWMLSPSE